MSAERGSSTDRLPWTYWPIFAAGLLASFFVASLIGAAVGMNPYIAGLVGAWLLVLREVAIVGRGGRR